VNRKNRRRAEAAQRVQERRLQKDAEEREGKTVTTRTWAMGAIKVVANDVECFEWSGTKQEAVALQQAYLDTTNALLSISGIRERLSAHSYAKRAAGYLMAYGMPKAGDADLRPSNHGNRWNQTDIDLYKSAILWLALREHIPNTGQKLEDVFVGKALVVMFNGDRERILADTARELGGESFAGRKDAGHVDPGTPLAEDQFQMMVAVLDHDYRLDPRDAVSMLTSDLCALAGKPLSDSTIASEPIYVPRIPIDATEADAMLRMIVVTTDATNPSARVKTYAGYTDKELSGGRPYVRVAHGEADAMTHGHTMGATEDKGFDQYRELFRRVYSESSDREIGEGWMRGEAAAASGVDGMIIHPTGEAAPPARDDDIRLSASYGQQSFKARVAASYFPRLIDIWPDFLRQMRKAGIAPPVTDDKRHDAREFIFSMIVENRWQADGQIAAVTAGAIAWLATTSPAGAAIGHSHRRVHYEITDLPFELHQRKSRNFRLMLR